MISNEGPQHIGNDSGEDRGQSVRSSAVRVGREALLSLLCHCRDWQHQSGSAWRKRNIKATRDSLGRYVRPGSEENPLRFTLGRAFDLMNAF